MIYKPSLNKERVSPWETQYLLNCSRYHLDVFNWIEERVNIDGEWLNYSQYADGLVVVTENFKASKQC